MERVYYGALRIIMEQIKAIGEQLRLVSDQYYLVSLQNSLTNHLKLKHNIEKRLKVRSNILYIDFKTKKRVA